MRHFLTFYSFLVSAFVFAQVVEEIQYPLIAIEDDCHSAYDSFADTIVISKEEFVRLSGIWSARDSCFQIETDTQFAVSFNTLFKTLETLGSGSPIFVNDGNLNNEYTGIREAKISVKPYSTVQLSDIRFERGGALYEVSDLTIIIDSLVLPQKDKCWQLFPFSSSYKMVTKQELISLLSDSLGYNNCKQRVEWLDSNIRARLTIAPIYFEKNQQWNTFLDTYSVNNQSDMSEIIDKINTLSYADQLYFDKMIYTKKNEYRYAEGYRFSIQEKVKCTNTYDVNGDRFLDLENMIDSFRNQQKYSSTICLMEDGNTVSFKILAIPKEGSATLFTSVNGQLNYRIWQYLRQLKTGDKVIIESIKSNDLSKNSNYEPIMITVR